MKIMLLAAGLFVTALACNSPKLNPVFNTGKIPVQTFTVDVTKETKLRTSKGATILIPAGAIDAGKEKQVELEVKEAYSIEDIVKAGLPTISDGIPLSSGGMICIKPARSSKASVKQPFYVSIPTPSLEPGMDLYVGEEKNGTVVNWKKSDKPLLPQFPDIRQDTGISAEELQLGNKLFQDNCATCHSVFKDLTGPALAHITSRMKEMDPNYPSILYDYTRNNQRYLANGNLYFQNLYIKWNYTPMNAFPNLTNDDLDALYAYIENESKQSRSSAPPLATDWIDSCMINFMNAGYKGRYAGKGWIIYHPEDSTVDLSEHITDTAILNNNSHFYPYLGNIQFDSTSNLLSESANLDKYYLPVFNWGWHNIDKLMENISGAEIIDVSLTVDGVPDETDISAYLFIPELRVNIAGRNSGNLIRFPERELLKTVPGYKAFIIATTTDSTKLYAGISEFVLNSKHDLTIQVKPSSVKATEKLLEKISAGIPKNTFVELSNNELDSALAPSGITSSPDSNNMGNREVVKKWAVGFYRSNDNRLIILRKPEDERLCSCMLTLP